MQHKDISGFVVVKILGDYAFASVANVVNQYYVHFLFLINEMRQIF